MQNIVLKEKRPVEATVTNKRWNESILRHNIEKEIERKKIMGILWKYYQKHTVWDYGEKEV